MFNKNLFKAEVIKAGMTLKQIAGILGMNIATLYRKLNGESDFTRNEIALFKDYLKLEISEIDAIFFAKQLT